VTDKMREALKKCAEGWENAIELKLLPPQHVDAARCLLGIAREALAQPEHIIPASPIPASPIPPSLIKPWRHAQPEQRGEVVAWMTPNGRPMLCKGPNDRPLMYADTAPPAPAVPDDDGYGPNGWREAERLRLLDLRALLTGAEIEEGIAPLSLNDGLRGNGYLDAVTLRIERQPGHGAALASRLRALLAAAPEVKP